MPSRVSIDCSSWKTRRRRFCRPGETAHWAASATSARFRFTRDRECDLRRRWALLVNDTRFVERAEIAREKGTDRSRFRRARSIATLARRPRSPYCPSGIEAAFLVAQMEEAPPSSRGALPCGTFTTPDSACEASGDCAGRACRPIARTMRTSTTYCCASAAERERTTAAAAMQASTQPSFRAASLVADGSRAARGWQAPWPTRTTFRALRCACPPSWAGLEDQIGYVLEHVVAAVEA